jgi:hypothetical protein
LRYQGKGGQIKAISISHQIKIGNKSNLGKSYLKFEKALLKPKGG